MRKVTSITTHATAEGKRISITYSEIDENGIIVNDNVRVTRVVVSNSANKAINELETFAQGIIDAE